MISVCMATYNGEKYLREQVESILIQLGDNDELVVSDDGSTDATVDILQSFNDHRINIFHNKVFHGVNANFENALRHAGGEFIFLSDQDDVWLSGKVASCLEVLKEADCVVHDAYIVNASLVNTNENIFARLNARSGFMRNFKRNAFTGCCMAFNRKSLKIILPFPESKLFYHDNWIGLLLSLKMKVVFIPFIGILFRRHDNTTSFSGGISQLSLLKKIQYRVILLLYLLKRVFF